jgi:cytochrome c-type biogenesis protein CcsB
METYGLNLVVGLLLLAMISVWIEFLLLNNSKFFKKIVRFSTITANIIVTFILCLRWILEGHFPISNLYESLLFLTSILLTIYLYLEKKTKNKLIGAIVIPVTLLINSFLNFALSPEMQISSPLVPSLQSNWLLMHVSMMLFSYATLMMGSLFSILFLVISRFQNFDFKLLDNSPLPFYTIMVEYYEAKLFSSSIELSKFGKLKFLKSLDELSYRIIGFGFPCLTIGIVAGGVWANESWSNYWSWDPKETWSLITWLIFATYLHARITKNWEGNKTAIVGSFGFLVIWICYLGVNFLARGLHTYGSLIK